MVVRDQHGHPDTVTEHAARGGPSLSRIRLLLGINDTQNAPVVAQEETDVAAPPDVAGKHLEADLLVMRSLGERRERREFPWKF
jgi:hypothetical protein